MRRSVWQVVVVVNVVLDFLWDLNGWVSGFKLDVEFVLREGWPFRFRLFLRWLAFFGLALLFSCLGDFFINLGFEVLFKTVEISYTLILLTAFFAASSASRLAVLSASAAIASSRSFLRTSMPSLRETTSSHLSSTAIETHL